MRIGAILFFALLASACQEDVNVGSFLGGGGEGGAPDSGGVGGTEDGGASEGGGFQVRIHMASSTAPFNHQDGLAGQTPLEHVSGIKSLTLYEEAGGEPYLVFDYGQDAAEVDYADGADTVVHTARAADLKDGVYKVARVVHSWVRYRVEATLHSGGLSIPGTFDNFQAMSDDTRYDDTVYDAGDYEYVFDTGTMQFPTSGSGAPIPELPDTGGFSVVFEDGEWAYYFPIDLPVDSSIGSDADVILSVNMHESFRWLDQDETDYADDVFDTTTTSFEPVLHFGANSFALTVQ